MMRPVWSYLLDTNIVSDLVRHPAGIVAKRIASVGERSICTNVVVAAELRFGARKKGSPRLSNQLLAILSRLEILPLESPVDERYAEVRLTLEQSGTPIGPNDLLIAAHALALDLVVVTDNVNEFQRVPGLRAENWLRSSRKG